MRATGFGVSDTGGEEPKLDEPLRRQDRLGREMDRVGGSAATAAREDLDRVARLQTEPLQVDRVVRPARREDTVAEEGEQLLGPVGAPEVRERSS